MLVGTKNVRTFVTANQRGALVQLVRMPPCHGGGHGFESHTHRSKVLYKPCRALFFCKHYYKVTMRSIAHEKSPAPQRGAEPV